MTHPNMATTHLFLEFFNYNHHANKQFIQLIQGLDNPPEKTITFIDHIFNAHQIWLNRIHPEGEAFGVWQSHDRAAWQALNAQLHQRSIQYLKNDPVKRDLQSQITYKNSKGQSFTNVLQDIYFHVINHGTHHRSQIALLLRQNEIAPPASDYIFYRR